MTEQEIRKYLRQMQEEDSQTALRKFYDLCFDRFFRIAYYYLKTEEWAQEVVLDVFMKIWEKRESLHTIANLEDYFFITVKNAALNYLEKEQRRKNSTEELSDTVPGQEYSPEETLITEELFSHYVKALDRLPERCREIFIRIREEKQSYAQVAKELGISTNTVDVQLQKAVTRLRDILSRYLNTDED
ncbi:RNA polymerase sigma-70 factor [Parabacteroides faecis]|jgi:RNA polymerase sigma-70 factor|uniref:RNA polymerase sigma-70 factor n=1 Tax=Parabacteroides TaxID=375288 RepID=UPI000F00ED69|nr:MULTISPECIES: RNA polymerase sigma-70 factor [Parabacteroides]MCS2890002.1 RNA polymerase sigma-70 factor [Parabacteroides faecis]RHR38694.1 RNA polymerase sigma-70 factor [Parabacteroides sp. AF18-52]UVQ46301.1 RNA polymerase sigma-70 factor [Parabacteroides faecis]